MEIERIDLVERLRQLPTNTTRRLVVEISVCRDHCDDAFAVPLDKLFSKRNKLQVVVMKPMFALLELDLTTWLELVFRDQTICVVSVIAALCRVWGITDNDHNRIIAFDNA